VSPGKPRVYLVDASIYIFRAWFSVPGSLTNSAGQPINAVHGFAGFLAGFLAEAKPMHAAVVFDESLTTSFRNDLYPDYKANREPAPLELKRQFRMCRQLVEALGLAGYSSKRYEADDLIGTLAAGLRPRGFRIEILSADKDLAQLIGEHDVLWDYARNRRHGREDIPALLGVEPGQVADWLALTGDAVDNIQGIPGIGAKTAAALLAAFGSLDDLYEDLDAVVGSGIRGAARIRRLLEEHEQSARLARELTGIAIDSELDVSARAVRRRQVESEAVAAVCRDIGLGRTTQTRLLRALGE
jgi:5'-3' exonuclease